MVKFWLRYLRSKTKDMILKNSSKLIEIDENLIKLNFLGKKILWLILGTLMSIKIVFEKPIRCFGCGINYFWNNMRFSSISIHLLEIFRIISIDLKYLSQNWINFNMLGVFWNPQDEQISKLSPDLHLEQHLKEILRVLHC